MAHQASLSHAYHRLAAIGTGENECPRGSQPPIMQPGKVSSFVARKVLTTLADRAAAAGPLQEMWQDRQTAFQKHVDGLSTLQVAAWTWRAITECLLPPRRRLTQKMFPIATMSFNNLVGLQEDFRNELPVGMPPGTLQLEAQSLITPDHVLLDSMWLRPLLADRADQPKTRPILVFAPPNGMIYEECLVPLCHIANDYGLDVIAFNHRGIGKSTGELNRISDAVTDAATVLQYACSFGGKVAILGLSMGGGTAATALSRLVQSNRGEVAGLDLFLAAHTFSSWQDVYAARLGRMSALRFSCAVKLFGMRDLTTCKSIWAKHLPKQTVVIEAEVDSVLPKEARLGNAVLPAERTAIVYGEGVRHGDMSFLRYRPDEPMIDQAPSVRHLLKTWSSR